MGTVGKLVVKAALVLAGGVTLGYAEYRIKGGEPIHKLYQQVVNERMEAEAMAKVKSNGTYIKAEGNVK